MTLATYRSPHVEQTSGRVLAGPRHELVITYRSTLSGHLMAIVFGAALAGFLVMGLGV